MTYRLSLGSEVFFSFSVKTLGIVCDADPYRSEPFYKTICFVRLRCPLHKMYNVVIALHLCVIIIDSRRATS